MAHHRRSRTTALFLTLAFAFFSATEARPWGFPAHRLVNGLAARAIPRPLAALYAGNVEYLSEHAIDPDLWVMAGKEGEGPNHFLDLDAFDSSGVPRNEADHLARNGAEAGAKGRVPWRIAELQAELVQAFRDKDAARVLERSAVLGHYVADIHVPLHAIVNYDGQTSGQKGVHARWESQLFVRFERQVVPHVKPGPPRTIADPLGFVFDTLRTSARDSRSLLASDEASAGPTDFADTVEDDRYNDPYYSKLFEHEERLMEERLTTAATAVASFWLSAWETAGKPSLDWSFHFTHVRGQRRLIMASLDAASARLVADAAERGLMPELAALRSAGATAEGALTCLPGQTASGHATLLTAAWPRTHGVTGNWASRAELPIHETVNGFRSTTLRAEPFWVAAARQGQDVTTVAVPQTYPFTPFEKGSACSRACTLMNGYQTHTLPPTVFRARELAPQSPTGWTGVVPGGALEVTLGTGADSQVGLLIDDPTDPVVGFDTLLVAPKKDIARTVRLKPREASASTDAWGELPIDTPTGSLVLYFRLFALSNDAKDILLFRAEAGTLESNRNRVAVVAGREAGGFVPNAASAAYRGGLFGPTLAAGGDGTAERRYLETVRLTVRQFTRLAAFAAERTRWKLLLAYLPFPDEAIHLWGGQMAADLPGHDADIARRLGPFVDEMLTIVDGFVGELRRRAGDDTLLAIVSDHGMVPVYRRVRLNVALERAGLVALDASGRADLAHTSALVAPSGYVLVNRSTRPKGIVPPEGVEEVLRQVRVALQGITDPATGAPLVVEFFDPAQPAAPFGIGGKDGGDLYLRLAPGHRFSPDLTGPLVETIPPVAQHMLDVLNPEMETSFALAGPGVAAHARLPLIDVVDVVPTLGALVGLEPPKDAEGRVRAEALSTPPDQVPAR